ncbi:unnamed protein product [Clavelina lepadiformis]|uniref:Uncharacterized protein n=1 Tax=Clavelina lepadiformis TaxID=159417 RepID=A0ABP0F243_CLALP
MLLETVSERRFWNSGTMPMNELLQFTITTGLQFTITALARQAISQMKVNMGELSASTSNVIGSVSRDLEPGVLMALPKKQSLKRTLQRKRRDMLTAHCTAALQSPMDTNFTILETFQRMILHDSGPGNNRLILLGSRDLLDGLARAKLWLADGTFKVVPSLFFQLYTVHFELVPGLIPAAVYCLVQNKTRATYDRILDAIKTMIPTAVQGTETARAKHS